MRTIALAWRYLWSRPLLAGLNLLLLTLALACITCVLLLGEQVEQAAALEGSRLLPLLGGGSSLLRGLGAVLLFAAALSLFIAFWSAVRERRADMAMLRMLGATPARVAGLLLCEALCLAGLASLLGLAAGHGLTSLAGHLLEAQGSLVVTGRLWVPAEAWIPVAALGGATLAALVPALSAYRVDVAQLPGAR